MKKLELVITTLLAANGNDQWKFSEPITVRLSDQDHHLLEIYGLAVSPKKDLYVLTMADGHGYDVEQWDKLEESQTGADKVIHAIHSRVMRTYINAHAI